MSSLFRATSTGVQRLGEQISDEEGARGLPRDLRISRDGKIHFLNYRRAGPIAMYAPSSVQVLEGGKRSALIDATRPDVGLPLQLRSAPGGLGIRSFDIDDNGHLSFVADVAENSIGLGKENRQLFVGDLQNSVVSRIRRFETGGDALYVEARLEDVSGDKRSVLLLFSFKHR